MKKWLLALLFIPSISYADGGGGINLTLNPKALLKSTNTWQAPQVFLSSTTFSSSTLKIGVMVYFMPSSAPPTSDSVLHYNWISSKVYFGGDGGGSGGGGGGSGGWIYDGITNNPFSTFTVTGATYDFSNGIATITVTGGGGSDNLGSHVSTRTLILPFGISASSGVFSSSINVMGVIVSSSSALLGGATIQGNLMVSQFVGIGTGTPVYDLHILRPSGFVYSALQALDASGAAFSLGFNDSGKDYLFGIYGSGAAGTYFGGVPNADAALFAAEGASSLGFGTSANSPIVLGTTNIERMRIYGNGAIVSKGSMTITGAGGAEVTYGATVGTLTVTSGITFTQSYKAAVCQSDNASLGFSAFTSSQPSAVCAQSSTTVFGYAQFLEVSTKAVQDHFSLPTDWVGAMDANIVWMSTETSGNVVWQIKTGCVADAEMSTVTWNAASTVTDATKSIAGRFNQASISGITTTGCAGGEELFFDFRREGGHASDSMVSIANLVTLQLVIRRTLGLQ